MVCEWRAGGSPVTIQFKISNEVITSARGWIAKQTRVVRHFRKICQHRTVAAMARNLGRKYGIGTVVAIIVKNILLLR